MYVYPNARGGRVIADVLRLDKGYTEGLEPNIMRTLIEMLVSAPGGKAANGCWRRPSEARPMAVRLFRVILPVGDLDQAAAFYAAILGWPGERVSGGWHYFDCGGTILACVVPRTEHLELRPNIEHVYFSVDYLEETFARAASAGCLWLGAGIETRPWGERSFYARDPSGNPVCFVQSGTEFTGGRFVP